MNDGDCGDYKENMIMMLIVLISRINERKVLKSVRSNNATTAGLAYFQRAIVIIYRDEAYFC